MPTYNGTWPPLPKVLESFLTISGVPAVEASIFMLERQCHDVKPPTVGVVQNPILLYRPRCPSSGGNYFFSGLREQPSGGDRSCAAPLALAVGDDPDRSCGILPEPASLLWVRVASHIWRDMAMCHYKLAFQI